MGRKKGKAQIKFAVGDRIRVNITEIPKEQRQCEVGEIIKMYLKFRATPKYRSISITVIFDKNYIKEKFWYCGGISSMSFNIKNINNPDVKYPVYITKE